MKKPLLSVIIPTKDCGPQLQECLEGIKKQTYKNIEIIVSDGKSKDNTRKIAKNYGARVLNNSLILAEPGVSLGMKKAKGDLLMILAVDNIFVDNKAVEKIVSAFNNPKIYAAFPRHESDATDTIFTKYINTFTDPASHFIYGYAANSRTFYKIYKRIKHTNTYDVYDFSSSKIKPLLALAQGFTIRKDFLNFKKNDMDDISPIWELIGQHRQIAYVYSVSLLHHTIRNMDHFMRKQRWALRNSLEKKSYGLSSRTNALTSFQKLKVYLYPFYAISIIPPFSRSLWHFLVHREKMWLSHTFITFLSGIAIWQEYVTITLLRKDKKVNRQ